jgi:hypothetical protein
MEFKNGKITYARNLDHYQYRVLERIPVNKYNKTWTQTSVGPLIPRKNTDKLFMCIGLQTIEMAPGYEYTAVVSIRGRT